MFPKTFKGFVCSLIRYGQSFVAILREKQRVTNSHTLSQSSKYHAVKVEGVVTPPQGNARASLILLV